MKIKIKPRDKILVDPPPLEGPEIDWGNPPIWWADAQDRIYLLIRTHIKKFIHGEESLERYCVRTSNQAMNQNPLNVSYHVVLMSGSSMGDGEPFADPELATSGLHPLWEKLEINPLD